MLNELHIRNFAIIDDLRLAFGPGLNILTGETGAGKSIIIDALGLLLGDRATASWVRAGSELAIVEATFRLPLDKELAAEIQQILEEQGVDDPDTPEWIFLSRQVRLNGRNICRINGNTVNRQLLSEVASKLIDVHGQGEHLNLLRPRSHIRLLDRYAHLDPQVKQIGQRVAELRKVQSELQRLRQDARTIAQRIDLLNFQTEEIFNANLQAGEDELLENEQRRLSNAETLITLAQTAQSVLNEGEGEMPSALDLVSEAVGRIERLARIDAEMDQSALDGQSLLEQLSDLARTLQYYAEGLEYDPERLLEVEARIELIANLKRKYGDTIAEIIAFGERAQNELDEVAGWEVKTAELEAEEDRLLHDIGVLGAELSDKRLTAGEELARRIETELADLRMERARFGVAVTHTPQANGAYLPDGGRVAFNERGVDHVEFMISANPGEPLKPMAKVASGGETARLMLALKSSLTQADATPTLIFDEIDQGIGGRVGTVVGQKLWGLTCQHGQNQPSTKRLTKTRKKRTRTQHPTAPPLITHQVLCITHLAQLAAFGDQHFTVNKRVVSVDGTERTNTVVAQLEDAARIEELTQMLGAPTAAGRRSIEEMLEEVAQVKGADNHENALAT